MSKLKMCPVFGFYAASRKLIKLYTKELEAMNLTYPQYLVISCLLTKDGRSVDEIGQSLYLDSGTLTPLLKRLESNGLITREHSREDERKRIIKLTEQGRDFEKELGSIREQIRSKIQVSPGEIQQLTHVLNKILSVHV